MREQHHLDREGHRPQEHEQVVQPHLHAGIASREEPGPDQGDSHGHRCPRGDLHPEEVVDDRREDDEEAGDQPGGAGGGPREAIGLEGVPGGEGQADDAPHEERAAAREAAREEEQHQHGQAEPEREKGGHRVAGDRVLDDDERPSPDGGDGGEHEDVEHGGAHGDGPARRHVAGRRPGAISRPVTVPGFPVPVPGFPVPVPGRPVVERWSPPARSRPSRTSTRTRPRCRGPGR